MSKASDADSGIVSQYLLFTSIADHNCATKMFQYTMSKEWFWDPTATFQANHRLIFIGLHNKHGEYEWTDGSRLGYVLTADWNIIQPVSEPRCLL